MDTKTAGLIGTIVKVAIALAGAVLCFLIMANSSDIEAGDDQSYVNGALTVTYIAMLLCVGAALLFGLVYFLKNIRNSKGLLFGLVGLAVVAFVSYSLSDAQASPELMAKYSESTLQMSGAGIYLTLLLLGIGVAAALFSEVTKIFK
ncbi:MAG: hypothetical protein HKN79_07510 [Flavobacteriales bacterium]|nr:hypothetical protein [Flavobacteriales bacterium]